MEYTLIHNEKSKQYEIHVDDKIAKIKYYIDKNTISLTHTIVSHDLKCKGLGKTLAKMVLEEVEKTGMKVIPVCPFLEKYIKHHPEWEKILV